MGTAKQLLELTQPNFIIHIHTALSEGINLEITHNGQQEAILQIPPHSNTERQMRPHQSLLVLENSTPSTITTGWYSGSCSAGNTEQMNK